MEAAIETAQVPEWFVPRALGSGKPLGSELGLGGRQAMVSMIEREDSIRAGVSCGSVPAPRSGSVAVGPGV